MTPRLKQAVNRNTISDRGLFQSWLKSLSRTLGMVRGLGVLLRYRLLKKLIGEDKAFRDAAERLARIPGQLGLDTRAAFYGLVCRYVGCDVFIGYQTLFSKRQVYLGDRVYIGRFCVIGLATIEDEAKLADGVQVLSGRHHHMDEQVRYESVTIGRGAWIGAGAVVMADVGKDAIVGAGAVVTQPIPDGAKVAGIPARQLRSDDPRTPMTIAA
jgi:acetyltransferase-like isoleucine patch superfamily enzyme